MINVNTLMFSQRGLGRRWRGLSESLSAVPGKVGDREVCVLTICMGTSALNMFLLNVYETNCASNAVSHTHVCVCVCKTILHF